MENKTKTYCMPTMRIVEFTNEDVITTSMVIGHGNSWYEGVNPWEQQGGLG